MNSPNHILIGTVVYEYIKEKYGIVLHESGFLKGNTCPDHGISFLRPHRMRYCSRMVKKKTVRICRTDRELMSARASKKIGILCHYYADFFCCAHNPQFSGNLKQHVKHEDELLNFMYENYSAFFQIDYIPERDFSQGAAEINRRMSNLFREKPVNEDDYGTELVCAIHACAELVLSVCLTILLSDNQSKKIFTIRKAA